MRTAIPNVSVLAVYFAQAARHYDSSPTDRSSHTFVWVLKCVGFHAFRRYRAAVLRKGQVPQDLITLWLGHARTLTDHYAAQLRDDEQYRSEWCERAGLGFSVVTLLHTDVVSIDATSAA
jgi:integrase